MQITKRALFFLLIQVAHILLFACLVTEVRPWPLISSGVATLIIYGLLLYCEFASDNKIAWPFLFYLIGSMLRLGIGTIYAGIVVMYGMTYPALLVGPLDMSEWLMEGHVLLLIGDLCFIGGYYLVFSLMGKCKTGKLAEVSISRKSQYLGGAMLAMIGLILRVADLVDIPVASLGQLTGILIDYAPASGVYLMLREAVIRRSRSFSSRALLAYAFMSADIYMATSSYMKSQVFISIIPVILIWIELIKNHVQANRIKPALRLGLQLIILAYLVVFVMGIYTTARRTAFEFGGGKKASGYQVDMVPYMGLALRSAIPGTEEFEVIHEFPNSGFWGMAQRFSQNGTGAWVYRQVQSKGVWDRSFFKDLLVAVIPRPLWPDKPQIWPSRLMTVELGMAKDPESATTSTGATMAGGYYWYGGWGGLSLGMLVSGAAFGLTWFYIGPKWHNHPLATTVVFLLLFQSLHWFEGEFLGGLPTYAYIFLVYIPVIKFFPLGIFKTGLVRSTITRWPEKIQTSS